MYVCVMNGMFCCLHAVLVFVNVQYRVVSSIERKILAENRSEYVPLVARKRLHFSRESNQGKSSEM